MLPLFLATHALALGNGAQLLRSHAAARGLLRQPHRHASVRPAMVSLPFGGGGGSAASGPSEDTLAAYRLMGLDIDASYEEIERSFEVLVETYAGDAKRKIKLQVAKDKILEDRLRQAMSGGLKNSFAKVVDPFDRPVDKPLISIPPQLQGIMELPDKELLLKNAVVFGLIGLMPLATASWAPTSITLGFGVSLYLLYNRGVPDQGEMGAEMRPPKPKPLLMATGITLLAGGLGATILSSFTGVLSRLLRFVTQEFLIGAGAAAGFFIAATLFKVQDEY